MKNLLKPKRIRQIEEERKEEEALHRFANDIVIVTDSEKEIYQCCMLSTMKIESK